MIKRNEYEKRRIAANPEIVPFYDDISAEFASRAYYATSHFPERGGAIARAGYAEGLLEDKRLVIEQLESAKANGGDVPDDYLEQVESWFESDLRPASKRAFESYLSAKGRTMSSFITGPANFPVARNQKRLDAADNRYQEYNETRAKVKKAFIKMLLPFGDGSAIMSDDPNAVPKLEAEIAKLETLQERMKLANKIIRAAFKKGVEKEAAKDDAVFSLMEQVKLSEANARELVTEDRFQGMGFASYQLTNNNANIKRLKGRLKEVAMVKQVEINDEFENGISVTVSDDQKIVIDFGFKPSEEIRAVLKSNAFKWSRYRVAWVRKMTANAVRSYARSVKPMLAGIEA